MTKDEVELDQAIQRLNERAWGIGVGLLTGLGLFIATNVLILQGGEDVGSHLALLGRYFPGYTVTFVGSLIGFVYCFVLGYILGRVVGTVYNRLVRL